MSGSSDAAYRCECGPDEYCAADDCHGATAAWRFGWWAFRYGVSLRLGHLFVSVGIYPEQKYPSDWRPVVVEWKERSWPR